MNYSLSADAQRLLDEHLATCQYGSPEEVLTEALQALQEQNAVMADIQASMDDLEAGRVRPLNAVVDEIRRDYGFSADER